MECVANGDRKKTLQRMRRKVNERQRKFGNYYFESESCRVGGKWK